MKLRRNYFSYVLPSLFSSGTRSSGARRTVTATALVATCSALMACSAAPTSSSEQEEMRPPDMNGPATNPDGTPVTNPDGTPVTNPDGTPVTNPDGTPVTNPDGTPVTNPDGTPVTNPDGTPVTNPDDDGPGDDDVVVDDDVDPIEPATECVPGVPATTQLPRLDHLQYDNTIADLLLLTGQPSSMLAPHTTGSVDQRAWDGYQAAAESLAAQVITTPESRDFVIPCTPSGDDAECAQQFVTEFGLRAFRRPLTDSEVTRFMTLYNDRAELTENGTFDEAAQLIIETFLSSPYFLTRAETSETLEGDYIALNGYEVASRLSYLLWASMPDDTLFAAAASGGLSSPDQILAEARRMLEDDKARSRVADFHQQYAHMGPGTRWAEISRDPAIFPEFSEDLVPLLSQETELLFDHIVFEQAGTFQDLLTSPVAFVNQSTAGLYGLDASGYGAELEPVNLDPAERPGVFTRLGFLTSHSSYNRTSPILRGAFLEKEVLCTVIPPPPDGATGAELPSGPDLVTNRQRVDAQTAGATCVGCHHGVVNPPGFALESFDAIGMVQTVDNGEPVNTEADVLIGDTSVTVAGPADLMSAIAASDEAQRCYAKNWVQYAYQRELTASDVCTVDTLTNNLAGGSYTVVDLIADLTQSDSFRYRSVATEAAQ